MLTGQYNAKNLVCQSTKLPNPIPIVVLLQPQLVLNFSFKLTKYLAGFLSLHYVRNIHI
jgi:hypothetical protein